MYKTIADLNGGTHVLMTDEEEAAILAQQAANAISAPIAQAKADASKILNTTVAMTAQRCMIANVPFPAEWQTYVTQLRAIVNTGTGEMPTQPAYPAGT
jgi:hypothetical protein